MTASSGMPMAVAREAPLTHQRMVYNGQGLPESRVAVILSCVVVCERHPFISNYNISVRYHTSLLQLCLQCSNVH